MKDGIIDISGDLQQLERDLQEWLGLSYHERMRSDEDCMAKYGCTNIELYNQIKSDLISHAKNIPSEGIRLESYVMEGGFKIKRNDQSDLSKELVYDRLERSRAMQDADEHVVIIDDFVSDEEPDYDMAYLNAQYDKYLGLPDDQMGYSDDYSIMLWGRSVPSMYHYMKNKIETIKAKDTMFIDKTVTDKNLNLYIDTIEDAAKEKDIVEYYIRKIDCLSGNKTLYESAVLESAVEKIPTPDTKMDYRQIIPRITPYLTYDELLESVEVHKPVFEYIFGIEDQKKYFNTVRDMQIDFADGNVDLEKDILEMGWNPYIPVNGETIKAARERQIKYLNTYENCRHVNVSRFTTGLSDEVLREVDFNDNNDMQPVHIVMTITPDNKLNISGISLTDTLGVIYNYQRQVRYSLADLSPMDKLDIRTIFIPEDAHIILKKIVTDDFDNGMFDSTKGPNITVIDKVDTTSNVNMVCNEFISWVIDRINNGGKVYSKNKLVVYCTYFDLVQLFKLDEYHRKIMGLINLRLNIDEFEYSDGKTDIFSYKLESLSVPDRHNEYNKAIRELADIVAPVNIIKEVKFPIGFNKKGDLYIVKSKDLQAEYNEAHRLLYTYDESNPDGIKHELARLFYLNNIIEKKIKKIKDNKSKEYKELIDLRARILNDFTTYFKIINTIDRKFDFSEYFKQTEYYDKEVIVGAPTMKYSGSIIKKFLKSL